MKSKMIVLFSLFLSLIFVLTGCLFSKSSLEESESQKIEKRFEADIPNLQVYYMGDLYKDKLNNFNNPKEVNEDELQRLEVDNLKINYLLLDEYFTNYFLADKTKFHILDRAIDQGVFIYFQSNSNTLRNRVEKFANNGNGEVYESVIESKDGSQMNVWILKENNSYIKGRINLHNDSENFIKELLIASWRYKIYGY